MGGYYYDGMGAAVVQPAATGAAAPPASTIAFVRQIDKKNTNNTLTVPVAGCAAGNTIIVTACNNDTGVLTGITDSKSNTYVVDKTAHGAVASNGVSIAHSIITVSLVSGDTLSLTFSSQTSFQCLALAFSGITAFDKSASASAESGVAVDSTATAALTNTGELYIGVIKSASGPLTDTTAGLTSGGDDFDQYHHRYLVLGATTAAVSYVGTLAGTASWVAAVGTFR